MPEGVPWSFSVKAMFASWDSVWSETWIIVCSQEIMIIAFISLEKLSRTLNNIRRFNQFYPTWTLILKS